MAKEKSPREKSTPKSGTPAGMREGMKKATTGMLVLFLLRLVYLQVIEGNHYLEQADNTTSFRFNITAARGEIVDATGKAFTGNTTIGAVITNGAFSKAELNKIASMTRCAYARCINPVATMADGDSIYAASIGDVSVDINMAGTLAAEVMAQAIQNAIHTSQIPDEEFLKYV